MSEQIGKFTFEVKPCEPKTPDQRAEALTAWLIAEWERTSRVADEPSPAPVLSQAA